jgi:hypothetical protein
MINNGWTERDIREDLLRSPEYGQRKWEFADKIIRRAYLDILGREPDPTGLSAYRTKILDQGWDEHDVREALRRSPEFRQKNQITLEQAEQVVRRAYLNVLHREPDPGSRGYVDRVLRDHWTEQDVARELRNSDEYRNKYHRYTTRDRVTLEQAEQIVRRAYLNVLRREPDPGSRGYVDRVLRDHWTEQDVARELLKSDEYRRMTK